MCLKSATPIVGFCNCSMFCCTFNLFVLLVSRDWCVALLHDASGLSAVCDYGIS